MGGYFFAFFKILIYVVLTFFHGRRILKGTRKVLPVKTTVSHLTIGYKNNR